MHDFLRAVGSGGWKNMRPHSEPAETSIMAKSKRHVNKVDAKRIDRVQAFDWDSDIGEATNVVKLNAEVVLNLENLATWAQDEIGDHGCFG